MNRNELINSLERTGFDLIVIGGGITGAGIAREASLRGLRVALVEACDFGYGTSSRSTKLIHGGLRYLKNFEFRLVRESVVERQRLLQMAPHLVKVTPFLFPVYRGDADSLFKLNLGLTAYDWFAGRGNPLPHRIHKAADLLAAEPGLRSEGLQGGALYCDCRTNDGRLTLEVVGSAAASGAVVANYLQVEGFLRGGGDRIVGVQVRDQVSRQRLTVRGTQVIAAAGPWADHVRRLDAPESRPLLRLTSGVHLTFPHARLPLRHAVVIRGTDGRMMFAIATGAFTYVGTTDNDHPGDPDSVGVTPADVEYILNAAQRSFPSAGLRAADIVSTWAGVRPLLRSARPSDPTALSRGYALFRSPSGLVTVGGGKLTAFRAMASHIVDEVFPATRGQRDLTRSGAPLSGGASALPSAAAVAQVASQTDSSVAAVQDLADYYGPAFKDVAAEFVVGETGDVAAEWLRARVRHAVKREKAVRLEDILARRTDLMLFSQDNGRSHLDLLADEMGALLGWSPQRRSDEVDNARRQIEWMFAWAIASPR